MTIHHLESTKVFALPAQGHRWFDSASQCTLIVATPSGNPGLWSDFVEGADRSYRKHGVECALDVDAIASGADTALFFAVIDARGEMLGGLRAKGPYATAVESHALVEWAGQPAMEDVRQMITDRLPFGVAEMKSAWVGADPGRSRAVTTTLARTGPPTMILLNVDFVMATSAAHILDQWRSSGGVVAENIAAAPYPDERYATKIMWWERHSLLRRADPIQAAKMVREIAALAREKYVDGQTIGFDQFDDEFDEAERVAV